MCVHVLRVSEKKSPENGNRKMVPGDKNPRTNGLLEKWSREKILGQMVPGKIGPQKNGARKIGPRKIRPLKIGPRKIGPQINGPPKIGSGTNGPRAEERSPENWSPEKSWGERRASWCV